VKARQDQIANKYIKVIEAVREHHSHNRLNGARRPKSLLSGLIFCGCCAGPYSLRGADRFACSAHVANGSCSNSRTIPRVELEERVLAGLKHRMMAPEVVAAAMRAYAEETNRLNRERRSNGDLWRTELEKTERELEKAIDAILAGIPPLKLKDRIETLESRKIELIAQLSNVSDNAPDLLPTAALIYAKKVGRLTEALNRAEDRAEATEAIRGLIEKIVLRPGPNRGEIGAELHGELGTILSWIERQAIGKAPKCKTPAALTAGVSVSVVAGARNHLKLGDVAELCSMLGPLVAASKIGLFRAAA
jgi:site-specific DNA recombinase